MDTIFCSNCGTKNTKGSRFCGACGEKIIPLKTDKNYCSSCGYKVNKDEKYCPECGTLLKPVNTKNETDIVEKKVEKKPKSQTTLKTNLANEKKGGCLGKFGKILLWLFAILIVTVGILYFIGDENTPTNTEGDSSAEKPIENISEKDMKLPPIIVKQANPILTETKTHTVVPKSSNQKFSFNEKTKVFIPANFTAKEQSLFISKASVNKEIMVEDATALMLIDLSLENNEQPSKPVEISYSYTKNDLNPKFTAAEQLEAFRWDEEGGNWVRLPIHIDQENHTVSAIVDHFSISGFFLKAYIVSAIGEKLFNDVYITPQKNFKIMYSKKEINNDGHTNDVTWKNQWDKYNKSTGVNYSKKHPRSIQDLGVVLEHSLSQYTKSESLGGLGMKNPTTPVKGFLGTYKTPITVKISSLFSKAVGDASYEKIEQRLHLPMSEIRDVTQVSVTAAHELFHRLQAVHYKRSGMWRSGNSWFLEATAEYAAHAIAWPNKMGQLFTGFGNNYLEFSINETGYKKATGYGWARDYEYLTAAWISTICYYGANLKDIVEFDAADYYLPRYSIDKYLRKTLKKDMGDMYRSFAHHMIFADNSPLKNHKLFSLTGDKAIAKSSKELECGNEHIQTFNMPNIYSSQLKVVKVKKKEKGNTPVIISCEKKETAGQVIDVFILKKNERYLSKREPSATMYAEDSKKILLAGDGDLICVVLTNAEFSGGITEVKIKVTDIKLSIEPTEILDAVANKPYSFKIKGSDIPKEIENVKFEWDFSDGSKSGSGFMSDVAVNSKTAKIEIEHQYESSDEEKKYPLKILMKDEKTGISLATAKAYITLPIEGPKVFITERHVVGPPGATFDIEALASPEEIYKFVWTVQGMAEEYTQTGKKSGIAPVINEIGEYSCTVKLYNMKDEYLATDRVTIYVEEDEITKEMTDIEGGKVKKVIYRCDKYYYGCNVGAAGTVMFENSVKEMEKLINDFTKQGRFEDAAKARKNLAERKANFQLEKDTTSCNCQRKRTPTFIYE
jgi:hypothetical protein